MSLGGTSSLTRLSTKADRSQLDAFVVPMKRGLESEKDVEDIRVSNEVEDAHVQKKVKKTRGSRACIACRHLKMRCIPIQSQEGPPCTRCLASNLECTFEKSMRGRRRAVSHPAKPAPTMNSALKKMERALGGVIQSIGRTVRANPYDEEHPSASMFVEPHSSKPIQYQLPRIPSSSLVENTTLLESSMSPPDLIPQTALQASSTTTPIVREILKSSNIHPSWSTFRGLGSGVETKFAPASPFFHHGPLHILPIRKMPVVHPAPPTLIEQKVLTETEVVDLFDLYYQKCHIGNPLLDPVIHTATATQKWPFLFTLICTVASRYYTKRTDRLYYKCLKETKRMALEILANGSKSLEICQGIILLVNWNLLSERYEQEMAYQLTGIVFRMAQDLNLHKKIDYTPPPHLQTEVDQRMYQREILNRERTWMCCFINDRALAIQLGKPYTISREDSIIRSAKWWYKHPEAQSTDIGVSMVTDLHVIFTTIIETLQSPDSPDGLDPSIDYTVVVPTFLDQLEEWRLEWDEKHPTIEGDFDSLMRTSMRYMYHQYYRLFILSFAMQHALSSPDLTMNMPVHCAAAYQSASNMIAVVRDVMAPTGFLQNMTDMNFVMLVYGACFLLKLMTPSYATYNATYINPKKANQLIRDAAEVLDGVYPPEENKPPSLYASFVRGLLANREKAAAQIPSSQTFELPQEINSTSLARADRAVSVVDEGTVDGLWDSSLMTGFGGPLQGLMGGGFTQEDDSWDLHYA